MKATYSKLQDGSWGIRIVGDGAPGVKVGQTVTVHKRNGDSSTETIDRVLWTSANVALCSIQSSRIAPSSPYGICADCGETCGRRYRRCLECAHDGRSYYDRCGRFVLGSDD